MVVLDDLDRVIQLLLPRIQQHLKSPTNFDAQSCRPFKLVVTGLQGSGKSTWSSKIVEALRAAGLKAETISLDDLYLPHDGLIKIRNSHPNNKLLRTRGQPGTHDINLAKWFFNQFDGTSQREILYPIFDKSKFGGEGDRLPKSQWERSGPIDVLVFEGWCLGFQALSSTELDAAWQISRKYLVEHEPVHLPIHTIAEHSLPDILSVNNQLKVYCDTFMGPQHWDFLVHLDTDNLENVYTWRLQQEEHMRSVKGTGMTDDMVIQFVRGYMPAYELYLHALRQGFFTSRNRQVIEEEKKKQQLSVILDSKRSVTNIVFVTQ